MVLAVAFVCCVGAVGDLVTILQLHKSETAVLVPVLKTLLYIASDPAHVSGLDAAGVPLSPAQNTGIGLFTCVYGSLP